MWRRWYFLQNNLWYFRENDLVVFYVITKNMNQYEKSVIRAMDMRIAKLFSERRKRVGWFFFHFLTHAS